jgi:hypothetical protein
MFATTGTLQVATGRHVGFRTLKGTPSVDKIRLGGWLATGLGVAALLLATSLLTAGVLRSALQVSMWTVLISGSALLQLRLRNLQGVSTDSRPPAVTRPWTLVGACGAVTALALLVGATVDLAVAGSFCAWPQTATTLSGIALLVSVVPALVAIRQTLRHEPRPIAYWLMVVADVAAVLLYVWLLSAHDHACAGGFVPNILR